LERKVSEIEAQSGLRAAKPAAPTVVDMPKHMKALCEFVDQHGA
jgi:hypothetical protein